MIKNEIYDDIVLKIVNMKIKPGERLSEIDTSKKYHVSRTPIRDIFKKLEDNNLVEIISQSGTFVTKIDPSLISDQVFIKYSVELTSMSKLLGKLTASNLKIIDENLNNQKDVLSKFDKNSEEIASNYFALDNQLHLYLYKLVDKENVLKYLFSSQPNFQRYRFLTFYREKEDLKRLVDIHISLIDCLKNNDLEKLKDVIYLHNYSAMNGIDELIRTYPDFFINK